MARGKRNVREVTGTVHSFVDDGFRLVEELRDEIQEWRDGLPENLSNSDKAGRLDECLEALGNCDYPPDLDDVADLECKAQELLPKRSWGRVYISRGDRLQNALNLLEAAASALESHVEAAKGENGHDGGDDNSEDAKCAEELRELISEFEGAEFPGAFG